MCFTTRLFSYYKFPSSIMSKIHFLFVLQVPCFHYNHNDVHSHTTSALSTLWPKSRPNLVHYTFVGSIVIKIRLFSCNQCKCVASTVAKIVFVVIFLVYVCNDCQTYICVASIKPLIVFAVIQLENLILIMKLVIKLLVNY